MPIAPGLDGTETNLKNMAVRYALQEAPALLATATAVNATTGQVTVNGGQGVIVSPNLTAAVSYQLNVSNSFVSSTDIVWLGIQNGTNTAQVQISPGLLTLANGSFTVLLNNINSTAHNGTIQIAFEVTKMISGANSPD